jgi:hypothetical protein
MSVHEGEFFISVPVLPDIQMSGGEDLVLNLTWGPMGRPALGS